MKRSWMDDTFTLLHDDHGITEDQLEFIYEWISGNYTWQENEKQYYPSMSSSMIGKPRIKPGFFITQVNIPESLGTVPCGLHGPTVSPMKGVLDPETGERVWPFDEPVPESEVTYEVRFSEGDERTWASRVCDRPFRPYSFVQVIGVRGEGEWLLYTIYGGPPAPQNPKDPSCKDVPASERFWSEHALSAQATKADPDSIMGIMGKIKGLSDQIKGAK
jgi:hypothetical protein